MWMLSPVAEVRERDVDVGLRRLLYDGVCSQIMVVLTGGAFLAAFALALGASNAVIGLIAAIGPFCQFMQIPAIFLISRLKWRKALVVGNVVVARFLWLLIAALPFLPGASLQVSGLLALLVVINMLNAVAGCAWNSWIRDFVPENLRGNYFARRMALATGVGAAVSLGAGFAIGPLKGALASGAMVYSLLFAAGCLIGFVGIYFLARTPEPRMAETWAEGFLASLFSPFRDPRFRSLLIFLGSWNFAINVAAPFFTVYLLRRLGFSMSWVIGFAVTSQVVNVLFFKVWGRLADRFTNKSCLSVAGFLFIFSVAMWPFTTLPERYFLTIPLLVLIHLLAGVSTAGVALCSGNIALKFAPRGAATSYLAVNGLINGVAATLAPVLAGLTADWFDIRRLKLTLTWARGEEFFHLPAIDLQGLDFLFVISVILGL